MTPSPYFIVSLALLASCAFLYLLSVFQRLSKLRELIRKLEKNRKSRTGILSWSGTVTGLVALTIGVFFLTPSYEARKQESLSKKVPLLVVLGDTNWYMRDYSKSPGFKLSMKKIVKELVPHAALLYKNYKEGASFGGRGGFLVPYSDMDEQAQRRMLEAFLMDLPKASPQRATVDGRGFVQEKPKFDSLFGISGSGKSLVKNHNFARAIENRRNDIVHVDENPSTFLLIITGSNPEIADLHYLFSEHGQKERLGKRDGMVYAIIRLNERGGIDEATLKEFSAMLRAPERIMTFTRFNMDFNLDQTGLVLVFSIIIILLLIELIAGGMGSRMILYARFSREESE